MSQGSDSVDSLGHRKPSTSVDWLDNLTPLLGKSVTTVYNPMTNYVTTTSYKPHSYQMGQFYSHHARANNEVQQLQIQQKHNVGSTRSQGSSSTNS